MNRPNQPLSWELFPLPSPSLRMAFGQVLEPGFYIASGQGLSFTVKPTASAIRLEMLRPGRPIVVLASARVKGPDAVKSCVQSFQRYADFIARNWLSTSTSPNLRNLTLDADVRTFYSAAGEDTRYLIANEIAHVFGRDQCFRILPVGFNRERTPGSKADLAVCTDVCLQQLGVAEWNTICNRRGDLQGAKPGDKSMNMPTWRKLATAYESFAVKLLSA